MDSDILLIPMKEEILDLADKDIHDIPGIFQPYNAKNKIDQILLWNG